MTDSKQPARPLTVSELSQYLKGRLKSDPSLRRVLVSGEISNFKHHTSGHIYFTLKDSLSSISCIMFAKAVRRLKFQPSTGMMVIVSGRASVSQSAVITLCCSKIEPEGLGALYLGFEQLKSRLEAEGLFRQELKLPLPRYPRKIVLITSPAGAAIQDLTRIIGQRWPVARVIIIPALVQGEDAPKDIVAALRLYNDHKLGEVAVLGRGGGSFEDLSAFNDESVARAIFASKLPVVSAVGHEPDVTISDFVADLRAATPSHAAELITPDIRELYAYLRRQTVRLKSAIDAKVERLSRALTNLSGRQLLQDPLNYVAAKQMRFRLSVSRLETASGRYFAARRQKFLGLTSKLSALSPLAVLSRGYAIASSQSGIIKGADQVSVGDNILVKLGSGSLSCEVIGKDEI